MRHKHLVTAVTTALLLSSFLIFQSRIAAQTVCSAFTCPSNVTVPAGSAACNAVVTYATPVVPNNCTHTINYTGSIDNWTVPAGITSITITAKGAEGGNSGGAALAGLGASMKGTFSVTPGQQLKILVGGSTPGWNNGGGGTFVTDLLNNPLIVAGGGGGSAFGLDNASKHGQTGTSGGASGNSSCNGVGGTGGNGGGASGCGRNYAGGGGGLLTNGQDGGFGAGTGGKAFINGGAGGVSSGFPQAGFGGGGWGSGGAAGGGGGGYSGGGSAWFFGAENAVGGGGGSFNGGTAQTNIGGANSGNGSVTITYSTTPTYTVVQTAGLPSGSAFPAGTTTNTFELRDGTTVVSTCSFNVTVNVPDATATPSSQTICSDETITTIALSGNVSGTTFNWTRDNTTTVTGIAASGAGDISGALTNTTNAPVTVTFTITPTANGCAGTPISATVVVNPKPTWYLDADGDGYYVSSVSSCVTPGAGYSTTEGLPGDCNDNPDAGGAAINPGATEVCDGIDNNCDDQIDEGFTNTDGDSQADCVDADDDSDGIADANDCAPLDATKWRTGNFYTDGDGDGYGAGNAVSLCFGATTPSGYNTIGGDCNDGNANILPGATEVCGNGIDENCNGLIDENCGPCKNGTNLTTSNITSNSATLNWVAPATPVQWNIEYKSTNKGAKWIDILVPGTARSYTLTGLFAKQAYNWQIKAKCGNKWTSYSGIASFTTLPLSANFVTTSISKQPLTEETSGELTIQNYPNPFSKATTIRYKLPNDAAVSLTVYHPLGQRTALLVNAKQSAGTHQVNFNAGKLSAGIYQYQLLTLDADGKTKVASGKMVMIK
jgi:hypothetical protein